MAYPDNLLTEGEQVVVHKHPHWKMLIFPIFLFLVVVGAGAYLAALAGKQQWHLIAWIAIVVVALVLIIWFTLNPLLRWKTTHFIVTTDRVMAREGLLNRTGMDIPLSRINSVRFEHGLIDRMWGAGTLIIESASDEPLEFDDIPHVEYVHSLLYREVNDNPEDDFRRTHPPGGESGEGWR
ncbi:MAG TPA: PH domain-containing protein [Pseudonocardiaceae bacterium]|jgi:membrane protein YdbS with pleckstrin-like domain|nr:PH domain-containing protein [Pseudonocardiaceae bacterium]